ncbi:FixH family protein [Gemmatimonas aurantiaca]|nr:FixH family protein [Gemmatimonas aurantiaca]
MVFGVVLYVSTDTFESVEESHKTAKTSYQEFEQAKSRAQAHKPYPILTYDSAIQRIFLIFPKPDIKNISGGTLNFSHSSDETLDTTAVIPAQPAEGVTLSSATLKSGLWNVTVTWTLNDLLYVIEYALFID